jgi:hypothetical protein
MKPFIDTAISMRFGIRPAADGVTTPPSRGRSVRRDDRQNHQLVDGR